MSELVFRRAGPADAAAIRALTHAAYAKWVPVIGRSPKPMNADYDDAVREHLIELAHLDGAIVGMIELIPAADHLLLENVAVDPTAQGKGIGRQLMARVEQRATDLGLPLVRLYTNKAFAANVDFYLALGYAREREEPFKGGFLVHFAKEVAMPSAPTTPSTAPLPRPESGSQFLEPAKLEWQATETPGFWIKPLLRDAGGGTTMLMRIDPGAFADMHSRDQVEEIFILEGEFSDQHRTYKTGDYCLRAIGAQHIASSKSGCKVLLVYRN